MEILVTWGDRARMRDTLREMVLALDFQFQSRQGLSPKSFLGNAVFKIHFF